MVSALLFDVFGTVVDWRSGVIRDVTELARAHGAEVDPAALADAWRAGYGPSMDLVRRGELPWTKLDELHRHILDQLLAQTGLTGLSPEEKSWLNNTWHRLDPWPDSVPGLRRLKENFIIAAFSNGNVSLLVDMARRAGLPWDFVFSAELFRHYKPDPEFYRGAVELLSLTPSEVMLVAAHHQDLQAAAAQGLATAFVARPAEWGLGQHPDHEPRGDYTCTPSSLEDLADLLSAG
ncbi:MAG TPA: haloacid dehalogenase type II [Streptosporangiaceae bacterium]|nr:haloacid dehalogenase type II [Streptosporangiaceae bacterium]